MLLDSALHKPAEAEVLYRKVLAIDPRHGYALYNLAVLLEERLQHGAGSDAEVRALFERAAAAAPGDALSCADLGRFLLVQLRDYTAAEVI